MADAAIHGHDHEDERGFFTRWFMSTNHKDIGILYLIVSAFAGFISVAFTVYMRLELQLMVTGEQPPPSSLSSQAPFFSLALASVSSLEAPFQRHAFIWA